MRHSKALILLTALLLTVSLTALAQENGPVAQLWDSGCDLLFRTDNVTVDGEAVFFLDGVTFKTAKLHYVQDGYASYYGLDLLTPREDGTERKTGWIIIADEDENYAVMEAYYPGVYRQGSGRAFNTLLHRTVELDALTELGGFLVSQAEPLLPQGAVTAAEKDGGQEIHIVLSQDQIPGMVLSALNLGANYLSSRWFSFGMDRAPAEDWSVPFEYYVTPTQALTDGTVYWTLKSADVSFVLDAQGRMTRAQGAVEAVSTYWDGAQRTVRVEFDASASDYGTSAVKAFDPADYGVSLAPYGYDYGYFGEAVMDPFTEEELTAWTEKTQAVLSSQGYPVEDDRDVGFWRGESSVNVEWADDQGADYFLAFREDGSLLTLENLSPVWMEAEEKSASDIDPDTVDSAWAYVRAFLQEQNPALLETLGEPIPLLFMEAQDGSQYLELEEDKHDCLFVVRIQPSLRIEYFSSQSNG